MQHVTYIPATQHSGKGKIIEIVKGSVVSRDSGVGRHDWEEHRILGQENCSAGTPIVGVWYYSLSQTHRTHSTE
jgi:hypothetical protein